MTMDSSNVQLNERMEFIGMNSECLERLRQLQSALKDHLPKALDHFYTRVRATPKLRSFFEGEEHISRAKSAQLSHWNEISSGAFDGAYASRAVSNGRTHARIGLDPRWYIGGYAIVVDYLLRAITTKIWPKGVLQLGSGGAAEDAGATLSALVKAVFLDMDIVISVYVQAAEEARLKTEAAAKALEETRRHETELAVSALAAGLERVAGQDLRYRINQDLPDSYRRLQGDFNSAVGQMDATLGEVIGSIATITSATREIAAAADDLSKRTEQQAASLEQTTAAVREITSTVQKTADGAAQAHTLVSAAKTHAAKSGDIVGQAVDAMHRIEKSSEDIGQIISTIDEIAFQTNLLALNAGVEAARAGEAGRGFAVVASEVRALAQRSAEAAKEIKALINSAGSEVSAGVKLVMNTGEALELIVHQVAEINKVVADIASGASEQSSALQQINIAIGQMDQDTQKNAAMVEETTAASHSLRQEAEIVTQTIDRFMTTEGSVKATPRSARPMARKAQHVARSGSKGREAVAMETDVSPGEDSWEEF